MPLIKPAITATSSATTSATTTATSAIAVGTAAATAAACHHKKHIKPTAKSMPVTPVQPKSPASSSVAHFTDFASDSQDNVYDIYDHIPSRSYPNFLQHINAHTQSNKRNANTNGHDDDEDDDVDYALDEEDSSSLAMITPPPPYDTPQLQASSLSAVKEGHGSGHNVGIIPPPPPPRRFLFGNREIFNMSPATPSSSLASAITPTKLSAAAAAMFAGPQMAQLNRKWTNLHRKRRRRSSSTDDSKELDKLVLQSVDWDENEMY